MKYMPAAGLVCLLSVFSFTAIAQSPGKLPFFATYFKGTHFNFEEAYIAINGKKATYNDLLQMSDSSMLKVELYDPKAAARQFGDQVGDHSVILFTTKKTTGPEYIYTTEDSLEYYTQRGYKASVRPDVFPFLKGDTTYKSWIRFLQGNLRADVPRQRGAPMGVYRVMVGFTVTEEGYVTEARVDDDAGYGTRAEVIRLMSQSPLWKPALYKGKPVKCYQRESIMFVVL